MKIDLTGLTKLAISSSMTPLTIIQQFFPSLLRNLSKESYDEEKFVIQLAVADFSCDHRTVRSVVVHRVLQNVEFQLKLCDHHRLDYYLRIRCTLFLACLCHIFFLDISFLFWQKRINETSPASCQYAPEGSSYHVNQFQRNTTASGLWLNGTHSNIRGDIDEDRSSWLVNHTSIDDEERIWQVVTSAFETRVIR